jgi:hypothetical protein
VQSLSQRCQKSIQKDKTTTDRVHHLFITLIRVHLFGTCGYKSITTESNRKKTSDSGSKQAWGNSIPAGISSVERDLVIPSVVVEVVVRLWVRDTSIYPISG